MTENTKPNPSGADLLEPQSGGRAHFGLLAVFATPVQLKAGAPGYTVPNVTDFEGNPKMFKGKVKVDASRTVHVVFRLQKTDSEGEPYFVSKDCLTSEKIYKQVILPSMKAVLKDLTFVNTGNAVPVQVEEVPTGRTFMGQDQENNPVEYDVTLWKVTEKYPTPEAMKAAADEFFAQFADAEGEGEPIAFPEGFTAESFSAIRANVKADMTSIGVDATANKWGIASDWLTANL